MNVLPLNVPILFGTAGNYKEFALRGWSDESNPMLTWNLESVAELEFRSPILKRDAALQVEVTPYVRDGELPNQEVNVYLNGLWVGFASANQHLVFECRFPRDYLSPRRNVLSFVMPNAVRPSERGWNNDARALAFAFRRVELAEQQPA